MMGRSGEEIREDLRRAASTATGFVHDAAVRLAGDFEPLFAQLADAQAQLRDLSGIAVPKSAWDEVNARAEAAEAVLDRLEDELEILPCYATDTQHAPHLVRLGITSRRPLLFVCPGVASPTPTTEEQP